MLLLICALFLFSACDAVKKPIGSISFECGNVFLTVSSLTTSGGIGSPVKDNELELNWDNNCNDTPEEFQPNWIGLFSSNPTLTPSQEPLVKVPIKNGEEHGYYKTEISLGKPNYPNGWNKPQIGTSGDEPEELNDYQSPDPSGRTFGPECISPYWIASYRNKTLIKANCIKIQPSWMHDHRSQIGTVPVAQLFIPGTHNSGCFYKGYPQKRDTFQRFVMTQDRDIWSQLVHGIRYLDFRIGFYPTNKEEDNAKVGKSLYNSYKLWLNHDLIRVTPLLPLIRDIRRFMELSKNEVVVLDIHRFPVGFTNYPERHQILLDLLQQELSHLILPRYNHTDEDYPTLNHIWENTNRRLIIAYGDDDIVRSNPWLWFPIKQYWGDEQNSASLKTYMQKVITSYRGRSRNPIWALMAQLTPTPVDVMFRPTGSLRNLADIVNRNVTVWLRSKWWKNVNVVTTDFFMGNNLIDIAINANVFKMDSS